MNSSPSSPEPPSSASPVSVIVNGHAVRAEPFATNARHAVLWPRSPSGLNAEASTPGSSRSFPCGENHRLLRAPGVASTEVHAHSDARPSISQIKGAIACTTHHTKDAISKPVSGEAEAASAVAMAPPSEPPFVVEGAWAVVMAVVPADHREEENQEKGPAATRHHHDGQSSGSAVTTKLPALPNELLLQILGYLDVSDLLATSRVSRRLRSLSLTPILHAYRLRHTKAALPPMLWSPFRPSLADLIRRSIFLTNTTVVSRKLARSLVCIRLSRRLAARPSLQVLVERSVLPGECLPNRKMVVAPALVAKKRAIERERVKDSLRRWVERVWTGKVRDRSEGVKQWEERVGVGRVWRMTRFWERIGSKSTAAQH